ncbi:RimJ/RimL family protein N-acetyltransferase [Crossiella equi]|uniref:RimJ/RimL family protein N-acetyltransferase n=1 Tax=Crossiella equi TaxID=130796 RepID=A0ABS5AI39_9PSEU|nr:GNAT family protein [Crossiella equi]MBP2476234.1 RimJ/RimL family protein N-acetyltransferase [Crossiella equi]
MTVRHILASTDLVALADFAEGDEELLDSGGDGAFDVDRDERPHLAQVVSHKAVVLDQVTGEVVGEVSWHAVTYGPAYPCSAWNFGIALLPSARGRGLGAAAQRLLVEHLFATTDLDRVEASTDVANRAEQRCLEKAGLRREGVLRGAQLRGGVRRDLAVYGILRTDLGPS